MRRIFSLKEGVIICFCRICQVYVVVVFFSQQAHSRSRSVLQPQTPAFAGEENSDDFSNHSYRSHQPKVNNRTLTPQSINDYPTPDDEENSHQ